MITSAQMNALRRLRAKLPVDLGLRVRFQDKLSALGVPPQGAAITALDRVVAHVERTAALVRALAAMADE